METSLSAEAPNVLIILADDLGYSDLGCYGGEIPTPYLDRLAAAGVRMSAFYATPRCSPTRASLLTGRYSHEVGIGVLTRPVGYRGSLDPHVPTLATVLKEQGYRTCLAGKWHLSSDVENPNDTWPTRRGFDEFYGILGGATSYFNPQAFYHQETPIQIAPEEDFYLTDALTDHAIDFTSRSAEQDDPFFLYLAYTAPHWPLHAREEDIHAQHGRYAGGWDKTRWGRWEAQERVAPVRGVSSLPPADSREDDWHSTQDPAWQQERMEVYAAQVSSLDANVGRILDHLDALGELGRTLILFMSDNGAEAMDLEVGRYFAPHVTPKQTRGGEAVTLGNTPSVSPGDETTFQSYGRAWANVSNTPFREYKMWVHEGGIAAPLICSWPAGGVPSGSVIDHPFHIIDVLPTVLAATGSDCPEHTAGLSFLDCIRGHAEPPERTLYWEHVGNAAIRRGDFKLVRQTDQPWELYDLSRDRAEEHDLSAAHPELVEELQQNWQEWAQGAGVIPWDDLVREFTDRNLPPWQARA